MHEPPLSGGVYVVRPEQPMTLALFLEYMQMTLILCMISAVVLAIIGFRPGMWRPDRAMWTASRAFGLLEAWVPKRISSEEVGDALEMISRHLDNSGSIVVAYLMVVKAIVLILAHVLYEHVKMAWQRKGG